LVSPRTRFLATDTNTANRPLTAAALLDASAVTPPVDALIRRVSGGPSS
jgi:hypothetical protein